jgi:hypothetical protein
MALHMHVPPGWRREPNEILIPRYFPTAWAVVAEWLKQNTLKPEMDLS